MTYPDKIDPARVLTMADLELSLALASTLVSFNDQRETVSALAEKWETNQTKIKFTLRKGQKWSDGTPIKALEFRDSLLRAKTLYGADLKALFDAIDSIETPDERTIIFSAKNESAVEGIILKLTEPMYSLVAFKKDNSIDLSKSSGPYAVSNQSKEQLTLALNENWHSYSSGMAKIVEIKPTPKADPVEHFVDDKWANLVIGSSIQRQATREKFSSNGYSVWERSLDKLFALYPTKPFIEKGGDRLMQRMNAKALGDAVMDGMSGYTTAAQFFPRGYTLWDSAKSKGKDVSSIPKMKTVRIIVPENYKTLKMEERLPKIIQTIAEAKVDLEYVPLSDLNDRMKKQDYDILATGIAVADPNFEGAVSFFIERDPPFIPSNSAPNNYSTRVKQARELDKNELRAKAMRQIINDSQAAGYVVPLFHFSSFSVAKQEIDLSGVPSGDETILFSKVRMK
jgi:MarR-like DNA-binding transcriptional regulator SgrR of sgrS sRNA